MTALELRKRRAEKLAEARKIMDASDKEKRSLTEEEQTAFDGAIGEADSLQAQIAHRDLWDKIDSESRESVGRGMDDLPHNDPVATRGGKHQYSLLRAISSRLNHQPLGGIEQEVHLELSKRRAASGLGEPKGILIPWDLRISQSGRTERRALDTASGVGSIPSILDGTMIEYLRAKMVLYGMGARVMSGMQGLFAIPRQTGTGTFYMVGESVAVTGSNQTIDQVPFAPHTGGAYTDYSRRFLEQTNQDAENLVREDLAAVIARGVETQALNGSGASSQLLGFLQNPNITTEAVGTNGGAPTWDIIVNLESDVAIANADMGSLGYVTDAAVRGKLKRTAKIGSTFPIYLWDNQSPGAPLNSNPCGITNLLPSTLIKGGSGAVCHTLLYGNWADMVFAFWSGLDVLVDPYSNSTSGTVRIVALQDFDVNLRHPESFSRCVDITVS